MKFTKKPMSINQNKEILDNNPITNKDKEVFSKVSKYFSNKNVNTNNKNNLKYDPAVIS